MVSKHSLDGTSRYNDGGILTIIKLIQGLLTKGYPTTDIKATDIVVVSMYGADKLRLTNKPKEKERAESQKDLTEVRVLVLDASQSAEFKIVIIHLVFGQDSAGFMTSIKRIK